MGFWHTGKSDLEMYAGLDDFVYKPGPPVRYHCQSCSKIFNKLEELRQHRFEAHPTLQPSLFLHGLRLGSLTVKLHQKLKANDIFVTNAVKCLVNNKVVNVQDLGVVLANFENNWVDVILQNGSNTINYKLDFQIASNKDLIGVEEEFLKMARNRTLDDNSMSRFISDCRGAYPTAMAYCDGICQYLYALRLKEGSDKGSDVFNAYTKQFNQANATLAGFNRQLAKSFRALIAFNFNHFEEAEILATEGPLKQAAGVLAGLLQGKAWALKEAFSPELENTAEKLLTDQNTLDILFYTSQGLLTLINDIANLNAQLESTNHYDKFKYNLIRTEALVAKACSQSLKDAKRLARQMTGADLTASWANKLIQRIESKEKNDKQQKK